MTSRSKSPTKTWNMSLQTFLLICSYFCCRSNIISSSVNNTVFARAFEHVFSSYFDVPISGIPRIHRITSNTGKQHSLPQQSTVQIMQPETNKTQPACHCWNKIFDIHELNEEKLTLAHSFRYFSP